MAKKPDWRKLLARFTDQLRIVSREASVKPGERGTKVELWGSQTRILEEIAKGLDDSVHKFYVSKSRQLGSTTVFVIILIFWLAVHRKMKGALVVDQDKTRDDFREVIRSIIDSIPPTYFGSAFGLKPKGGDNKYFMAFTNGSQLNFLVAGTSGSKENWGESSGYSIVILSEVSKYGSPEGLNNFEEAMSEHNPDRLYVYESTSNGRNHWYSRWKAAEADPITCRCIFVGWWSKELNAIKRNDARFAVYGQAPPDEREAKKIHEVRERYGHQITAEQLAWRRWKSADLSKSENSLDQNQPWLPEESFVLSGKSYFQPRIIMHNMERLNLVGYKGFRFYMGKDFWSAALEPLDAARNRKDEIQLRVWADPMPEGRYIIGVDPAGGRDTKNNNHCVTVWRCYADKFIQVAEYADNMAETAHCAWVLAYLAGVYRNCQAIVELNGGYGKAVMTELDHLRDQLRADYNAEKRGAVTKKNPKGDDWSDFLSNARYYIYKRPDSPAAMGYVLNWITNFDNKRLVFAEFRDNHINDILVVNSRPLLDEMLDVIEDNERMSIGAPGNQKDDRIMAACLANHAYVQHERPGLIMQGMTYERVTKDESGIKLQGNIVNRAVSEYFRNYEAGVGEKPPERAWAEERGLQ